MSRKSHRLLNKTSGISTSILPCILTRKRKLEETEDLLHAEEFRKRRSCQQKRYEDSSSDEEIYMAETTKDPLEVEQEWLASGFRQSQQMTCLPSPPSSRSYPLPSLSWADPTDVWKVMVKKDAMYLRDQQLLDRHPSLQARMRSILLDWLIEVSEVHKLHRETYYLAMDFIDRFLMTQVDILKHQLQLIGVTALFIASKLEEIYPPKLADFAYVTDGACSPEDIVAQELVMLRSLQWDLTPMTANNWLNIYMQLSNMDNIDYTKDNFVLPNYSGYEFVQVAQLIDLCTLDIGCLQFPYRVIAGSALYHMTSPEIFNAVTGFRWDDVHSCIAWLTPFAMTVRESGEVPVKHFQQVTKDDMHNIQTHSINLTLLEKAQARQAQMLTSENGSPMAIAGMLTPPQSKEKYVSSNS